MRLFRIALAGNDRDPMAIAGRLPMRIFIRLTRSELRSNPATQQAAPQHRLPSPLRIPLSGMPRVLPQTLRPAEYPRGGHCLVRFRGFDQHRC